MQIVCLKVLVNYFIYLSFEVCNTIVLLCLKIYVKNMLIKNERVRHHILLKSSIDGSNSISTIFKLFLKF